MSAGIRVVFLMVLLAGLISCSDNDGNGDTGESSAAMIAGISEIDPAPPETERVDEDGSIQSDELATDRTDNDERMDEADAAGVVVVVADVLPAADATNTTNEVSGTVATVGDPTSAHVGIIVVADAAIDADFFAYPAADSADVPVDLSALASHACHSSDGADIASMQIESAVPPTSVDAGEVIVVSGQHGTFVELERLLEAGQVRYATHIDFDEIGNPPNRLVVDIPGQVFPSFMQIEVPSRSSGISDEGDPNTAPDSYATASSTAVSNGETNPDGQETTDVDASSSAASETVAESASDSVRQVFCSVIPSVNRIVAVDTIDSVIVKKVQRGKDLLLLFRLVT